MSYSVTFKTTQYHTGRITSQLRDALPRYIAMTKKHPERFIKGAIFTLAESDWAADFLAFSSAMTAKPKALMDGKQILFNKNAEFQF